MKVEYINPFVLSSVNVFSTMLGCELTRGDVTTKRDRRPSCEITGVIGLSGKAAGTVAVGLSREAALGSAEAMLMEPQTNLNADVIDVVGELTNMIAGGAKAELSQFDMSISLPVVITGSSHSIDFPRSATPILIPFSSKWGDVCIEVGLVEQVEVVAV
ncbi:MAG: chemotaxis protein CheX [Pirellulaceae bacterium]|jgi:chemotaxis protein CheX|nr:chemotaxis protein CheX [Pirellulaceae bacterium]MDP7015248.1 chemotaxis protein CheX [Pirellulaceae bacterium]